MSRTVSLPRVSVAVAVVAAVTFVYVRLTPVNPTTVALTYVVAILLVATWWGIAEATSASLAAVLCFNLFFLPPVGTLTIADPQNWVALMAFLLTAIVASQLSGRARRRHIESVARQRDLERLYAVSRGLLLSDTHSSTPAMIARHIADAFTLSAVALYDRDTATVSRAGPTELVGIESQLREIAHGASAEPPPGVVVTAIRLGGEPIGSLAIAGNGLSDTVLQSIANLAAIALERARGHETAARAEAARQSGELRATVLDAVAHEFKTPLTSIRAASSALCASAAIEDRERELVAIVAEESDRLQAIVRDAIQMLRIDAGGFVLHRERHNLSDLVRRSCGELGSPLDGRSIVNRVPQDVTVDVDGELLQLALRQLLDNAVKYSPATSTIEVSVSSNDTVEIAVCNSGSVISDHEQARIFDRFYRGALARRIPGTGMGLPIVRQIAQAHGGSIKVSSVPGGTEFTLSLPRGEATP